MLHFCFQEKEVEAALREGRWPGGCDPALRSHVDVCRCCNDLVFMAQTLEQARIETAQAAHLTSPPGVLWWQAQLRLRNGAVERIARPIAVVEKLALVSTVLVALGLAAWQWSQITDWLRWLADLSHSNAFRLDTLWSASSAGGNSILILLIASLGTLALFGGLAVYLVAKKE